MTQVFGIIYAMAAKNSWSPTSFLFFSFKVNEAKKSCHAQSALSWRNLLKCYKVGTQEIPSINVTFLFRKRNFIIKYTLLLVKYQHILNPFIKSGGQSLSINDYYRNDNMSEQVHFSTTVRAAIL